MPSSQTMGLPRRVLLGRENTCTLTSRSDTKTVLRTQVARMVELSRKHQYCYRPSFDTLAVRRDLADPDLPFQKSLGLFLFCASEHVRSVDTWDLEMLIST